MYVSALYNKIRYDKIRLNLFYMDVKITINISTRVFDPCNDVAIKWPRVTVDVMRMQ